MARSYDGRARAELLHHEQDEVRLLLGQGPEFLLVEQRELAGAGGSRGRQPRADIEQRQGAERLALVDRADDPLVGQDLDLALENDIHAARRFSIAKNDLACGIVPHRSERPREPPKIGLFVETVEFAPWLSETHIHCRLTKT